ncbi:MAG: TonB-dependent receptor [Bacteroidota bacterium]
MSAPRYTCFSIVFLLSLFCFSQNTAVIYGTVRDSSNAPLAAVNIAVRGMKPYKAFSNDSGYYEITVPADTAFTLVYTSVGLMPREKTFFLKPGERRRHDLALDQDIEMIGTIDIEGGREDFIIEIPIETFFVQAGPSENVEKLLFSTAGVSSSNEFSSGYSVRGGNFDENLVYVNDVEVYRPFLVRSGQQEGLSFTNPYMVSSLSFSTGGFEARYGDKMSSVLDIKYKRPRKFGGAVSGSLLGGALNLEGCSEDFRFTWMVGARQKTNTYLLGSLDTKGEYKPAFYDVQTFFTYNFTDEWELSLLTNISGNKYRVVPESRQSDFGTVNAAYRLTVFFDGQEVDAYRTYLGALTLSRWQSHKGLMLKWIASAYRAEESETFDILGAYRLDALETDFGKDNFGQVSYNLGTGGFLNHARNYLTAMVYNFEHKGRKGFPLGKDHEYHWGIKYQHEEIDDRISEWDMTDSAGYSIPIGNPDVLDLESVVKTKIHLGSNRFMGYVQGAWSKLNKDTAEIKLTFGVRANYWDFNNELIVSPRAVFSLEPDWEKDFVFKAAAGYYSQPPFYREFRDPKGNINYNIKAQTSIHFVLGSDYNFQAWNRKFKFTTELYYKLLDNLIPYEIDNVRIRYYAENSAHGYATGIDMKVNGEFVDGAESWFSLSVMQTREDIEGDFYITNYNKDGEVIIPGYTFDDTVVASVRTEPGYIPRPTDQRVNVGIFFQDYIPKFPKCKVHLNLLFGSGLPFGPPSFERYKDTLRIPPYRRVDIGFSYELMGDSSRLENKRFFKNFNSFWISAEVYNLLAVNNTVSYLWVKDVTNRQYAIPNYLSQRLINVKLIMRF